MTAGKLDEQIILQSLTETNDGGSLSQSYATVATVWAEVISRKGREAFESARVNALDVIRVRIRYRSDVDNKDRFQWEGQSYNIVNVDRSMRRDGYMWLSGECVGAA